MIYQLSHNITSSLGFTSEENFNEILLGHSNLTLHDSFFNLLEPFVGALIDEEKINQAFEKLPTKQYHYTKFEKIAIISAYDAIAKSGISPDSPSVQFILSTTKGNVHLLDNKHNFEKDRIFLWKSAQLIAQFFNNPNEPIVVSNACISGASAQIIAKRLLEQKTCKYAIVIGADILSKFVVSGFQSFKALSPTICQPYDKNRCGLNLGEAAATIIYSSTQPENETIALINGAMANDANHISGPSRTGAGLYLAFKKTLQCTNLQNIAFINAHGTATAYNDDMESLALTQIGLQNHPINSLKSYFGHTLGAAGVLETIISSIAIQKGIILPIRNLQERGTIAPINSVMERQKTEKKIFIKALSGFGGSNAALLFQRI